MEVEPGHINSSMLFRFESDCGMKYHDSVNISFCK